MTTYNTQNPVPSVDVRDLYDNAENLDNFSNGAALAYPDRLGVSRQSLAGIRAASSYQHLGAYTAGLEFTSYNQTFSSGGEFYAPGPGITMPYTTTGVGAAEIANFRSVGDAILRSDLADDTDPAQGANLIGYKDGTLYSALGHVTPLMFGGDPTGTLSSQAAFDLCILAQKTTGVPIRVVGGHWLLNTILLDYDNASIAFEGNVTLIANVNSAILFHQAGSFGRHTGCFRTDSNGKSGVWGMACAPFNLTQTAVITQTISNIMPGIIGDPGVSILIAYKSGPRVGGVDSGCFYNEVSYARSEGALGFIKLMGAATPDGAPCNRNKFYSCRAGTSGGLSSNYGVYIEAGDTNQFFGCDFEGVGTGPARPGELATATAVKINNMAPGGQSNDHNTFFGGQCEANVRDLDIANIRTYLFGFGFSDSKAVFPNGRPIKLLPGVDSSVANTKLLGLRAIDEEIIVFEGAKISDWDAGVGDRTDWRSYPLNASNLKQNGVAITAIGQTASYYWQFGGFVEWHFRFSFQAVASGDTLSIPFPKSSQADLYTTSGGADTMRIPILVSNGGAAQPLYGSFVGSNLVIPVPTGTWNTVSSANKVWAQVRFHR